jgi:hypothetical protein
MAAQHPKLASDSLEKHPDNIAVSFLPDFESLFKKIPTGNIKLKLSSIKYDSSEIRI